jgi:hypothetical protein
MTKLKFIILDPQAPAIPNLGGIARPLVDAARATTVPGP